jgi:ABC-type sugar transport system permease subunit/ABC-type glycerol-3-phosphate transport system substrate-binding protein
MRVEYLFLLLGLAIVLFAVAGRRAKPPSQPKRDQVVLRMTWLWGGNVLVGKESRSAAERAERLALEYFLKSHPGITFAPYSGLKLQGSATEAGLLMAMAGGAAGELLYTNFRTLQQFIDQGFLYPLDDYVLAWARELEGLAPDAPLTLDEIDPAIFRIEPQVWEVIVRPGPDGAKHVYSMPYQQAVMALLYRRDIFRKAGLDPNRGPRDWAELKSFAYRVTDPEQGVYGFGLPAGAIAGWHFNNFLWQAGGEVVKQLPDGSWKCVMDDDAAVTALQYYRDLLTTTKREGGKTMPIAMRHDFRLDFNEGRCAMYMDYTHDFLTAALGIEPNLVGIAPLPAGPAGHANEINARMWGINATIKDKRVRDAAWEFIKFTCSDDYHRIRTRVLVEAGYAQLVSVGNLERFGYKDYLRQVPADWAEANELAFKWGHPDPNGRNCQNIYTEETVPLDVVMLDPEAAQKAAYRPGSPEAERDRADLRALLQKTAAKIDAKLLGKIDERKLASQRRIAFAVVAAIAAAMAFLIYRVVRGFGRGAAESLPGRHVRRVEHVAAWAFMFVALASIFVWAYLPLARGSVMAFQDYKILGGGKFVGLDNFISAFNQDTFWFAVRNTFLYVALTLGLGFFAPLILALLLNEVPRGKYLLRTIYYLPAAISGLVILYLWKWFYDPSPNGLLNTILDVFHIPPQTWLNDPKLAMLCIIVPGIWAAAGPGSIIYLAALKSIPEELYEAADLDGATPWRKIWAITLPYLKPLIIINLVGAFVGAFRAAENVFVMTGGGPLYATHVLGLEVWMQAFMYLNFGYATAVAWMLGAMLIGFTVYQLRILRRVRFTTAGA